jgi:hypothetical protein
MKTLKNIREAKEVWDKPNPKAERGQSEKLSPAQKARAKARARSAGRPYPNMVDNIWAARNEQTVQESGGDVVFKSNQGHIEKYSDHSYAVYRNGQKQTFYTTLQAAKSALKEAKEKQEYDYEGDMARSQLRSIIANAQRVHDMLRPDTNIAEWVQSKITLAADYITTAADYMESESSEIDEAAPAWTRKEGKNPTGGLNAKGVASYRRANPGSKLKMAVTTPPSKLDPDGKAAGRRRSFCARMGGSKGPMKDEKGQPTRKALALRKWNC